MAYKGSGSPFSKVLELQVPGVSPATIESLLYLAVEIAREGREGRRIGTLFTLGDAEAVLERSRPLILDPLAGHPDEVKQLTSPDLRETIKELAQLDGAFVISSAGVVRSACRYIDVSAERVKVPLGLGSRHLAGASISFATRCLAVVVSESAMVRVFHRGELASEIIPEVWILRTHVKRLLGAAGEGAPVAEPVPLAERVTGAEQVAVEEQVTVVKKD